MILRQYKQEKQQRIVDNLRVRRIHDSVNDSGFQIQEHSSGNVMFIVRLIEKDILSVCALCSVVFQDSFRTYPVLCTEPLPELKANYKHKNQRISTSKQKFSTSKERNLLWLPHWPSCRVIISHGILAISPLNSYIQKDEHKAVTESHLYQARNILNQLPFFF